MRREDDVGRGEDARALDDVAHLAGVAGPRVLAEQLLRGGIQPFGRRAAAHGHLPEEVLRDRNDVLGAGAQRQQLDAEDVESIVEVAAEPAQGDGVFEPRVGAGDDAAVRGELLRSAQPAKRAVLENAEQLRLQVERELMHLVEEERPGARVLEESRLPLHGAGERAALVSEQLRLEQVLGDRRAVDGDEGLGGGRTRRMHAAREELLAGSGFALDEDGRVRTGSDLPRECDGLAHGGRITHDMRERIVSSGRWRRRPLRHLRHQPFIMVRVHVRHVTYRTIG